MKWSSVYSGRNHFLLHRLLFPFYNSEYVHEIKYKFIDGPIRFLNILSYHCISNFKNKSVCLRQKICIKLLSLSHTHASCLYILMSIFMYFIIYSNSMKTHTWRKRKKKTNQDYNHTHTTINNYLFGPPACMAANL